MTPFIILFCLMGNVNTFFQLGADCGRGVIIEKLQFGINSESKKEKCLQRLSYYKKAFFTDQYGNTKEKISFSDFLNHYKSAGYEFPKEAIETEAYKFYRYANGGGYKSICLGCGNGDGLMNLIEMYRMQTEANRPT